jgi:diguanylate cyclase (GGDEF)-like protein/PAS domain S-box-containing protein
MTESTPPSSPGRLRSTNMRVRDIMVSAPMTCPPDTPIADAAHMMAERRVSSILVSSGDELLGIWTEHDALAHDFNDPEALEIPISEVMSSPVATISTDASASDAAMRFKHQGLRHFVALDENGGVAGLITQSDVVFNHGVEWFMRLQAVDSVLHGTPPVAGPEETAASVAHRLHQSHADAMVVHDPEGGLGILTERDVVRYIAARHPDCPAWEVSTRPLQTVMHTDSLFNARNLMVKQGFRHLGVVDARGELMGLIGFADIIASIEHGYVEELELALEERDSALRASEERYRALVELSPDAIAVHRDGELLFINPAGARLLGANSPEDLVGKPLEDILEHDADDSVAALIATETGATPREARLRPRGTAVIDVELSARPITYGGETAWQLILRNITERKRMEDELRRLATTDQLTGICNRPHFETLLDKAISGADRYERGFALIMFDLDQFKAVNDELGHDAGDRILREVVERLSPRLRDSDVFCRWGGEEFLILAYANDETTAGTLADKLRQELRNSVSTEVTGPITASFGVAAFREGETRTQLLKRLDETLYRAKRNGRDRVETAD